jgi:hypothetical protein
VEGVRGAARIERLFFDLFLDYTDSRVAANWRRKLPFYIVEELILEADWVAEVGGQRRFTDFTAELWRMEEAWSGECGLVHGGA